MPPTFAAKVGDEPSLPEVAAFLASISLIEHAYTVQYFSFACERSAGGFALASGRVDLTCVPLPELPKIETEDVLVGRVDLRTIGISLRDLLNGLMHGGLKLPFGEVLFTASRYGASTAHSPFEEPNPGERINLLQIYGATSATKVGAALDWQLRLHDPPYDGFGEVAVLYGLSSDVTQCTLRVIAQQVLLIDAASHIDGDELRLRLRLSPGAVTREVKVGCRSLLPGPNVVERFTLVGADFEWTEAEHGVRIGNLSRQIPKDVVVHCSAAYARSGQHRWFVSNPRSVRNSGRVAIEAFDEGLQTLRQYLEGKGKNPGANFEAAVADLLTLLGFQVLHLSGANRSKAPDLVARVPSTGDLILVECTTDTLKGDNKLGKLFARGVEVKEKLFENSLGNTRVLPVIVTSLPADQIQADVPEAERLGIIVIHQGDIREAMRRTAMLNEPPQLFEEGFRKMLSAKEKKQEAD